ncbi:MAG: ElyC/SanA/YdcF family protein [Verrucomicrobiota bacterium]
MFSTLMKVFGPLLHPVGLIWMLCIGGAICLFRKKNRMGAAFLAAVVLVISLIGSRASLWLLGTLEKPYLYKSLAEIPPADVLVVLGGGVQYSAEDPLEVHLNDASDRIVTAVELMRQGKAPVMVLGGGGLLDSPPEKGEAEAVKRWLQQWKLVEAPIHTMGISVNTRQEAMRFAALAKEHGWQRVLLVTSASQMNRAKAAFWRAGVKVTPVGCDFHARGNAYSEWLTPFPEPSGFHHLHLFLHEKIGSVAYRMRGWIGEPEEVICSGVAKEPPGEIRNPKDEVRKKSEGENSK